MKTQNKWDSNEPDGVDLSGNAHTRTAVAIANVISVSDRKLS